MKEAGVGWALRKAAAAVGFGVNKTYHSIQAHRETIKIVTRNPKGTFVKDFRIDGTEQDDEDPLDRSPIKVRVCWEDMAVTMRAFKTKAGNLVDLPTTRRYME